MKRWMSILLALVMILSLCACGASNEEQTPPAGLQAGFGREIVMPENPQNVHLNGTDTAGRKANGFLDYVKVTCIALRDEQDNTVLLFTMDVLGILDIFNDTLRPQVAAATGVAEENVIFCATHTHSAPVMSGNYTGGAEYREVFLAGALKAAQDAVADLSPAEMSYGNTYTKGLVFVRHYVHEDGKITASSGIKTNDVIVGHPTEADEEMQIIRFTRPAEDKKDIILMSWNSHPTFHGGVTDSLISADFPGPTRDYIESQGDYLVAYFTGDAGNQAPSSRIKEETHGLDYNQFGQKLGQYCLDALPNLKPATGNTIQVANRYYAARSNKDKLDKLSEAKEVVDLYSAQGRDAANELADKYGLYQVLEARAIIKRVDTAATRDLHMTVMSIGDNVSFAFMPYEMFTENGHDLRTRTPYDITFLSSVSQQGGNSYIPSEAAYGYGCYESYVSVVASGTGEELVEEYLNMLTALKNGQ